MVIGRHSRDDKLKHHPNDPALYRQLVARGHRLRLLGGTLLQAAFSGDPAASAVELLPAGSEDARDFLSGLDCFVYRKHPQFFETCGACILEAMSMAVPVILFSGGCRCRRAHRTRPGRVPRGDRGRSARLHRSPGRRPGPAGGHRCRGPAQGGHRHAGSADANSFLLPRVSLSLPRKSGLRRRQPSLAGLYRPVLGVLSVPAGAWIRTFRGRHSAALARRRDEDRNRRRRRSHPSPL